MNITWRIINLEWIEQVGENAKVVKNIHFWVDAVDDEGNVGYTWGNIQLDIDNITTFADFDTLTESQCIEWVKNQMNRGEEDIASKFEQQAISMCREKDPMRKRGFGVPWQS